MFKEIELNYFRKHEALTVRFENGLIALRGTNEGGKTTLLEAMGYCMFGTMALREPLSEVVTWGQKESALKTRMILVVNGADYHLKRSKSGAEISDGTKILATGQTEVKRYVEMLLGASAEVCRNLMMADQQAIRGALAKGPSAAIELIEELANFALIEKIVTLVQSKLPNGATASVESRIVMLDQQIAAAKQDDIDVKPLQTAEDVARQTVAVCEQAQSDSRKVYDELQQPARDAQASLDNHARAVQAATAAQQRMEQTAATLAGIKPVPGPDAAEVERLRKASEDAGQHARAVAAHKVLDALVEPENEWEGDMASLQVEANTSATEMRRLQGELQQHRVDVSGLKAALITETACGLCGKDLSNVPEVVSKNAETERQIAQFESAVASVQTALQEATDMHEACQQIVVASQLRSRPYQQAAEFITLDHGYVPARWTWTGPDTTKAAPTNAAKDFADAQAKVQTYQRELGRQQQAERDAANATEMHEQAMHAVAVAEVPLSAARETLTKAAAATQALFAADETLRNARNEAQIALQALNQARAVLAERTRAREALAAQLEAAQKELKAIHFNNALIKALRDARPEIANELWGMVAVSISKYFSDIRGVPSTFTRDSNGFKVDNHSVPGLSGSTLDSLGLATRIALPQTFLPNARFLILDEASAACDDTREAAMVGTVASAGFDQVIWATHSDAVQAFAQQTIQL